MCKGISAWFTKSDSKVMLILQLVTGLMQASMQNRKAKELIRMMLVYFRNLADAVDDVGPPYQFVVVGRDGVSFDCADS